MSEKYYRDEELKRLQLDLLDILKTIDLFCEENDITYFLDSGTALGAKRHNGFIPWDDDVDLGMLRKDYDRFILLAEKKFPLGYTLHTFENTSGISGMFAKVCKDGTIFETQETKDAGFDQGIFIDIFPYDFLSTDNKEQQKQLRIANFWQKASYLYHSPHISYKLNGLKGITVRLLCNVAHLLLKKMMTREKILNNFNKSRDFKSLPSDDLIILAYPNAGPYNVSVLVPTKKIKFEDGYFPCPCDIERYLEILYGKTWSKLPPESERKSHMPLRLKTTYCDLRQ